MDKWLGVLAGACVIVASVGGCGGKVENGGSSGGVTSGGSAGVGGVGGTHLGGGTGGMIVGGTGGMPPGGTGGMIIGGTGGVGGGPCGIGCPSFTVGGVLQVEACCSDGQCGAHADATLSQILTIPEGCYLLDSPGQPDATCPPHQFINPLTGQPASFPGCCRSSSGTCGVFIDTTSQQGPNLGCADISGSAPDQPCGSTPDCSTCVQTNCAAELNACLSDSQCMQLLMCVQNCTEQACVDKCSFAYPGAATLWKQVEGCILQKCATECA